jgi:hypothetical protein
MVPVSILSVGRPPVLGKMDRIANSPLDPTVPSKSAGFPGMGMENHG